MAEDTKRSVRIFSARPRTSRGSTLPRQANHHEGRSEGSSSGASKQRRGPLPSDASRDGD